jgi:cytochrome c oxidase cbb3-type subunit 3
MSQSQENLTDHNYDGIQEYDNPTPGWWTWIFIVSIIFSALYFLIVNILGQGQLSPAAAHERQSVQYILKQFGELAGVKPSAAKLLELKDIEKWQKAGAAVFQVNCVACHGRNGEGVSGPNLTDDLYMNAATVLDLYDIIYNGRNNGAMPAWGATKKLSEPEVLVVASYVAGLRGKNLPGRPPDPQRDKLIPPWSDK